MKPSTKAALLSALVMPGAGHIYLKKYLTGFSLIGISVAALYYLITTAVEQAMQIMAQIESGDVPLDAAAITELASQSPAGTDALLQNIATAAIILCWIVGVVDSYRLGVKQNKAE